MAVQIQDPRNIVGDTLTIPSGESRSNFITSDAYGMVEWLLLMVPATLTGTVTVEVLADASLDETQDASWRTLAGVTLAAGQGVAFRVPAAPALRLSSSGTEAAAREFRLYGRRSRVA